MVLKISNTQIICGIILIISFLIGLYNLNQGLIMIVIALIFGLFICTIILILSNGFKSILSYNQKRVYSKNNFSNFNICPNCRNKLDSVRDTCPNCGYSFGRVNIPDNVENNIKLPTPEEKYNEYMEMFENMSLWKQIIIPLLIFWSALTPRANYSLSTIKIAAATDFYLNLFKNILKKLKNIF